MNTLQISNKLIEAGLERKPAEAIAQTIDERNKELATKQDIKTIYTMFALVGLAFAYVFDLLNTIISKLGN